MSAAYVQVHFRQNNFMEASSMNSDKIASRGAVLPGPEAMKLFVLDSTEHKIYHAHKC